MMLPMAPVTFKLAGATYMDVHKAGGGIHYTVEHTGKASEDDLYRSLQSRLMTMRQTGLVVIFSYFLN